MSIGDAESYYQGLNLEGAKGEIADKIFKEIWFIKNIHDAHQTCTNLRS
jgi:hypothetical protein